MKWYWIVVFALLINSCASTARYKAIKKSRQNQSQIQPRTQRKSHSRNNTQLQNYIQEWLGVPYKYGGMTKNGVDCSGFTYKVYRKIYDFKLPRTVLDQYRAGRKISTMNLSEGDLIFFRGVRGSGIDHVGVYLEDGKFVHASTSIGVIISDLSEDYYKTRYVGACRY